MKSIKLIALVCVLTLISIDSFGYSWRNKQRSSNHWSNNKSSETRPVGAPLDGGLLAILGAAGVAYYAARKRKKNSANP